METIRVAILGCGRISAMHLDAISLCPDVKLVACCDKLAEKAEAVAGKYGIKAYTDYKKLIDEEKPSCVHVCLPHYLHVPVAEYALSHGVHVLTEKPMSIDMAGAQRVVNIAKEKNLLYGVCFQCRFNPAPIFVKKALTEGKLGKIISAVSTLTWKRTSSYYLESDWKGTWEKEGGGVVIDQAIHSVDLASWMIDSVAVDVNCRMANIAHSEVEVEDTAEGRVRYENGCELFFYYTNNYGTNEPIEIKLFCENGKVVFGYEEAKIVYNDGTEEYLKDKGESTGVVGAQDYWGNRHYNLIRNFYDAVEGLTDLKVDGETALKTQKIVCEMYEKGRKGCLSIKQE